MSFERTKNYLKYIENSQAVDLNTLLGLFYNAILDTNKLNGINDIQDAEAGNTDNLILNMMRLSNLIVNIPPKHNIDFSKIDKERKIRFDSALKECRKTDNEITEVSKKIEETEKMEKELSQKHEALEKKRGHLLGVEEECRELQNKIDKLNDPYLDDLNKKKKALQSEAAKRQKLAVNRSNVVDEKQKEIDELNERIKRLEKEYEKKEAKKQQLENRIESLNKDIKDFDEWIKINKKIPNEIKEQQARFINFENACNSLICDSILKNNIDITCLSNQDNEVFPASIKSMEDLINFFYDISKRTQALSSVYETAFKAVQKETEKFINNDKELK